MVLACLEIWGSQFKDSGLGVPFKDLNMGIPIIIPVEGRGFITHGSTLCNFSRRPSGLGPASITLRGQLPKGFRVP